MICRSDLQKLLGRAVSDGSLQKVVQLAQRLGSLQPRINTTQNFDENLNDHDVEFGFNLDFKPPSRFLLEIPLEEEVLEMENLVPSTSIYNDWSSADTIDNSFANGGIRYDLKWLKESCDLIVRGSGSELSRDELAMTICWILDSDKPGEEVCLDIRISGVAISSLLLLAIKNFTLALYHSGLI